tara:strand:+ start:374 stop:592 length:219 start_codon:yes stop_codon:yes gene_type:complete
MSNRPPKLKSQIDLEQPIQKYKVMVSQVTGYFIDVAASNEEDALKYAKAKNYYKQYDLQVVDTHYQIFTKEE